MRTEPQETRYRGLTFSPDNQSLYFSQQGHQESVFTLYQLTLNSQRTKKLLAEVDSSVTFSPTGREMAFIRENPLEGKSTLIIASADGSKERVLGQLKSPDFYSVDGPSWSPDGKLIATAVGSSANEFHYQIMLTQVVDGHKQVLGEQLWAWAMRVFWLPDNSGLLMLGRTKAEGRNSQIWHISYPAGKAHKVISDLNDYRCLSLTADSQKLVTIQSEVRSDLWVVPVETPNQPIQITNNPTSQNGYDGLDWAPDGKIVYTALVDGQQNLWLLDAADKILHGNDPVPKQLTSEVGNNDHYPSVSGDGRYIIFASHSSGQVRLWRMDIDGSNLKELTNGNLDLKPNCSPDGKWIVYSTEKLGRRTIQKVGIDGDQAIQLTEKLSEFPVISPDGKLVASVYREDARSPRKIGLFPIEGGDPIQILDIPAFSRPTVRWFPNGKALSYLPTRDDSADVWLWPFSGKPAQVTNFNFERIFAYAWSPDGRYLACARGKANRDVIMVTGFK